METDITGYESQVADYKGQIKRSSRLITALTAAIIPAIAVIAFGISHILRQGDKIESAAAERVQLGEQVQAADDRAAAAGEELAGVRTAAQVERERHLSQIDNLTRRITELSLTIESERKNQAELASLKQTLEILTVGGAEVSSGVPIGPALQSE